MPVVPSTVLIASRKQQSRCQLALAPPAVLRSGSAKQVVTHQGPILK
jgi:hypothetical protein